jgi:hypothetical protein
VGQIATGLLYGCKAPALMNGDDEAVSRLIDRWQLSAGIDGRHRGPRIRVESEGGQCLIGIWIAVGGSGEDDAPYFLEECVELAQVKLVFADRIAEAAALWKRFAQYAAETEKTKLRKPTLWLTPCETA